MDSAQRDGALDDAKRLDEADMKPLLFRFLVFPACAFVAAVALILIGGLAALCEMLKRGPR